MDMIQVLKWSMTQLKVGASSALWAEDGHLEDFQACVIPISLLNLF